MRLDPSGGVVSPTINGTPANNGAVPSVSDSNSAPAVADSHVAGSDLQRLIASVSQLPDVRPEKIQAAAAKLVSAELLTSQAAGQAAAAALFDLGP